MALKHVSISPSLSQDPLASQGTQYILFTCGKNWDGSLESLRNEILCAAFPMEQE